MEGTLPPPIVGQGFSFHLDNVSPKDALFLGQLCGMFCDPEQAEKLASLKAGRSALMYHNGLAVAVPTKGGLKC